MNSTLLAHERRGNGKEGVLVLSGVPGDFTFYAPMLPCLDGEAFSYVFPDYRGFGQSRHIEGEYTYAELVGDVIALADHLGWLRFHLIGHSFGGLLTQRLLVDVPGRIKSAVAVATAPACGLKPAPETREFMLSGSERENNIRGAIDLMTGNRLPATWLDWMTRTAYRSMTRAAYLGYLTLAMDEDFADRLHGATTPMLILAGQHDEAYPADMMRSTLLNWLPNAVLEIIPNCGHFPMQEAPVWLSGRVEAFMRKYALA